MGDILSAFRVNSLALAMPLAFAVILLLILIVSFRSRAVVFCQYLEAMTGIKLRPSQVARAFAKQGREGVREMFLDLIIREDLKQGPLEIPQEPRVEKSRAAKR
jgi:hypothetical protein